MNYADAIKSLSWSWNKVATIRSCDLRFRYQYLDRLAFSEVIVPLELGEFLHKCCDAFTKEAILRKESNLPLPDILWLYALSNDYPNTDGGKTLSFIRRCLMNFHRDFQLPEEGVVFSEFQVCLNKDYKEIDWWSSEAFFRLKIDRLDLIPGENGIIVKIRDYKTSGIVSDLEQLRIYCYPFLRSYSMGISHFELELFSLSSGDMTFEKFSVDQAESVWNSVLDEIRYYSALTEFPGKPSISNCSSCGYVSVCPKAMK